VRLVGLSGERRFMAVLGLYWSGEGSRTSVMN